MADAFGVPRPPGRRSMGKAGTGDLVGWAAPPPPFGKRLHWKLLSSTQFVDTIFEEIQPWDKVAPPLDTQQLERLFTEKEKEKPSGLASAPAPKSGANGRVCLLDPKRAQNLAIILRQVTLPTEQLCSLLRSMELEHAVTTEALEHIYENLLPPLLESAELFTSYSGPTDSLRDVERQLLPLAQLPRLKARLQSLLFAKTLPTTQADLLAQIRTLEEACQQVRDSSSLRRILGTVLRVGNFLNHGVDAPDAAGVEVRGFTMESLLRLRDFRAGGESAVTALHCVALHLLPGEAQLPAKLRGELRAALEVGDGAATRISELREAVGRFRREASTMTDEAERFSSAYCITSGDREDTKPLETLRKLAKDAKEGADKIETEMASAMAKAIRLLEYFGEKRAEPAREEDELVERFFVTLKEFTSSFEACWREVLEQPKKLRLDPAVSASLAREPGRTGSPKLTTKAPKEEKADDAGPGPVPGPGPARPKCGIGSLASEAAAMRRRSQPARPAAFMAELCKGMKERRDAAAELD
ncbi:unnamed protein product [Effrenium voratum]|nr:unnamed protein product [Effrenium voratum]